MHSALPLPDFFITLHNFFQSSRTISVNIASFLLSSFLAGLRFTLSSRPLFLFLSPLSSLLFSHLPIYTHLTLIQLENTLSLSKSPPWLGRGKLAEEISCWNCSIAEKRRASVKQSSETERQERENSGQAQPRNKRATERCARERCVRVCSASQR